jgi:hypothetical protein
MGYANTIKTSDYGSVTPERTIMALGEGAYLFFDGNNATSTSTTYETIMSFRMTENLTPDSTMRFECEIKRSAGAGTVYVAVYLNSTLLTSGNTNSDAYASVADNFYFVDGVYPDDILTVKIKVGTAGATADIRNITFRGVYTPFVTMPI